MPKVDDKSFGWRKAFSLYSWEYFKKGAIYPLVITLISIGVSLLSPKNPIFFIDIISGIILNISPGVIGFLLSGYAIIIGFSSNEVVKFMSKKSKESDGTLYQQQNAVFAVSIFSILIGLVSALFIRFIFESGVNFFPNDLYTDVFNYIVLSLILFIAYYSIFTIKDMIINVFNFGQLIHYLIQKEISKKNNLD